jgi:hypothetical protein
VHSRSRCCASFLAPFHLPCNCIAVPPTEWAGIPERCGLHIKAYDGYLSPDRWLDEFSTKPKIRSIAVVCTPAQIARSESSQINSGERSIFRAPVRFS